MFDLFGKMGEMKARMEEVKTALAELEVTGESGAGLVRVTLTGDRRAKDVEIDPSLLNPAEADMLQDLLVAAFNLASQKAEEQGARIVKEKTAGILPNIPGLDFGAFGK